MNSAPWARSPQIRIPVAGLLAWFLPGAGHLFIGERVRGVIFLTTIAVTFWTGVAVGGVKNTVNPDERSLWFMGQICTGSHALATWAWSRSLELPEGGDLRAYGRAEEVSIVYTAICGMLNILVIFDVLVRAERQAVTLSERGPPGKRRGGNLR